MTTRPNDPEPRTPSREQRALPRPMRRDQASFLLAATLFVFVVVIPLASRLAH